MSSLIFTGSARSGFSCLETTIEPITAIEHWGIATEKLQWHNHLAGELVVLPETTADVNVGCIYIII